MTISEAKNQLSDQTFLLGRFRRLAAIRWLAASSEPDAVVVLAEALDAGHPDKKFIERLLSAFQPGADQAKIDRLWQYWSEKRSEGIAAILTAGRWPCCAAPALQRLRHLKVGEVNALPRTVAESRQVLAQVGDRDAAVVRSVLAYAEGLPNEEDINSELFSVWARTESSALAEVLQRQGRVPGNPVLAVLLALVCGRPQVYQKFQDERGELFHQAYGMASEGQREAIKQAVIGSGDSALVEAYQQTTLALGRPDPQTVLQAAAARGDDDAIFEAARHLTLLEALPQIEFWAANGRRPQAPDFRQAVDEAVQAYQSMGKLTIESAPKPPQGSVDIFEWWQQQKASDDELRRDLSAEDPLLRARALYLGYPRGLFSAAELEKAGKNEDWLLRLVFRLLSPSLSLQTEADHVFWVTACSGFDAGLLQSRLGGTPAEYALHKANLAKAVKARTPAAQRQTAMLRLICSLQRVYAGGELVISDTSQANDAQAIVSAGEAPVDLF